LSRRATDIRISAHIVYINSCPLVSGGYERRREEEKDVLSIVGEGGEFSTHSINQRLESLGWDKKIVDPFTFELIIAVLEHEGDYRVTRTPIN